MTGTERQKARALIFLREWRLKFGISQQELADALEEYEMTHPERARTFLREWRLKRGMSQQELADKVGVNKSTIYRFENGHGRANEVWFRILKALNIAPDDYWREPPFGPETEQMLREREAFWQERQKYPNHYLSKIEMMPKGEND